MKTTVTGGFWSLPPDLRDAAMAAACEQYRVEDFFDLDPEVRRLVYRETAEGT